MNDNRSGQQAVEGTQAPEIQALTPENSAAWVEKYVAWASRVLDKQAENTTK